MDSESTGHNQRGSTQSLNTGAFSQFNSNHIDINSAFGPAHHVEQPQSNNMLLGVLMQALQQQQVNNGVAQQFKATNPLSPLFSALQQNNMYNSGFGQPNGSSTAVLNTLLQQLQQQLNGNAVSVPSPTITSAFCTSTSNIPNPLLFANSINTNCTTTNSNGANVSPPASAFYSPVEPKLTELPKINGKLVQI